MKSRVLHKAGIAPSTTEKLKDNSKFSKYYGLKKSELRLLYSIRGKIDWSKQQ